MSQEWLDMCNFEWTLARRIDTPKVLPGLLKLLNPSEHGSLIRRSNDSLCAHIDEQFQIRQKNQIWGALQIL